MVTSKVYLTDALINGGNPVVVLCQNVTCAGKKNFNSTPDDNILTEPVEVQTLSFENITYGLSRVYFPSAAAISKMSTSETYLSYPDLLVLYKKKYNGTNASTLKVIYGGATANTLVGTDGSTTDIKVLLTQFTFPLDVSDSKNAAYPVASLNFTETK